MHAYNIVSLNFERSSAIRSISNKAKHTQYIYIPICRVSMVRREEEESGAQHAKRNMPQKMRIQPWDYRENWYNEANVYGSEQSLGLEHLAKIGLKMHKSWGMWNWKSNNTSYDALNNEPSSLIGDLRKGGTKNSIVYGHLRGTWILRLRDVVNLHLTWWYQNDRLGKAFQELIMVCDEAIQRRSVVLGGRWCSARGEKSDRLSSE